MIMKDTFSKLHPLVNLAFFAAVLLFSMFNMHPVCLGVSLVCALSNALYLSGRKAALLSLKFLLPAALFITIINPLLNHQGVTIIEYLPWGNPLTLESVVYGFASAAMLCSVVLWFSCWNCIMTSDKLVYLFGKISPALSLVLSMALRFVPRFFAEMKQVRQAMQQMNNGKKSLKGRFKGGLRVLSVMISRAMEGSIETADSMKSRGYGLTGRTSFSLYRFTAKDTAVLIAVLLETSALIAIMIFGKLKFRYFPSINGNVLDIFSVVFFLIYGALMLTPLILNVKEGMQWKRLQSKI